VDLLAIAAWETAGKLNPFESASRAWIALPQTTRDSPATRLDPVQLGVRPVYLAEPPITIVTGDCAVALTVAPPPFVPPG
jgi:hypothetical protein